MTPDVDAARRVLVLRFAHRAAKRREHFYGDELSEASMPMSYYIWVVAGTARPVVVDTGFSADVSVRRGRPLRSEPIALLRRAGIDPRTVDNVVVTHLHYDHVGNLSAFPRARFWIQRRELDFWTSAVADRAEFRRHIEQSDLHFLLDAVERGRVEIIDGDVQVEEQVSLHLVGGHTAGLQVARVEAANGPLVIGGDALHYRENLVTDRPYSIVHDLAEMYEAFDRVIELAGSIDRILAGHDPGVMAVYPAASPSLQGAVAVAS